MKGSRLLIAAIAIAFFNHIDANARSLVGEQQDSLVSSSKVISLDRDNRLYVDSVRSVIQRFYVDQFRHFQDPSAPYFLFMSKDAQLAMGIGGCVRLRGWYDWGGAIPVSGFAPYLIPMKPDPADMRHLGATPAGSTLFFRVIGRNKVLGEYQLYIEANFNGYQGRDFHLKKAYAMVNDFTIGYANSTFSDPSALPPTVDAQGPNNKISPTSVLVRYMPTIRDRWVLAVSAEIPSYQTDVDNVLTRKVSDWMPDFAAFAQYQWGEGQHVRLSGIVRTLSYRDIKQEQNHSNAGWGMQLTTMFHPTRETTVYGGVNYGAGYAGLGGDLLIGNYDLVGDPERPGRMYAPRVFGWHVGLQYNIRRNLFVSVMASQNRYLPSKPVEASEYKYGVMTAANVFWNLTPRIQVGAEVDLGLRRNFDGNHRYARRAGLMAQFSF